MIVKTKFASEKVYVFSFLISVLISAC